MIHVVIGHRGTGKTSFGKRILFYHPEAVVLDLDEVISQREQVTIEHIFKEQGEDVFRQLEQKYFSELMAEYHGSRHEIYLVVGGGFEVDRIPKNIPILFIKRSSDSQGRIFLNRVRLQPELTPLEEYFMRYEIRETKFLACHSVCYEVPEGLSEYFKEIELNIEQRDSSLVLKVEKTILDQSFETDFCYTLHPQDVSVPLRMELICQMVSRGNVGVLELRDDLLSKTQIFDVIRKLPDKKILLSLRRTDSAELLEQIVLLPGVRLWGLDCDKQYWSQQILEIATGDFLKIISSHDASLPSFEVPNGWIMKWSPLISDWAGLG